MVVKLRAECRMSHQHVFYNFPGSSRLIIKSLLRHLTQNHKSHMSASVHRGQSQQVSLTGDHECLY